MSAIKQAAFSYLDQWCNADKRFTEGIAIGQVNDRRVRSIQEAANFYGVSRSLPMLKSERHRLERALDEVFSVPEPAMNDDRSVIEAVDDLAHRFKTVYGRFALSAASKLLWLRFKSPIVIYDSRAQSALTKLARRPNRWEYKCYLPKWREQFTSHRGEIAAACNELDRVREFSPADTMSDDEFAETTAAPWFHERVFDRYLWSVAQSE